MDDKQAVVTTAKGARCIAFRDDDGLGCEGFAVAGSRYCFLHAPERAGEAAAARRKGGQARHGRRGIMPDDVSDLELSTPADVLRVLAAELEEVLSLEKSLSRARTVAQVCQVWASIWGGSEFERRLALLEGATHDTKQAA